MKYTVENPNLFTLLEEMPHAPVSGYRQKLVRSGDRLEIEIGPVWDTRPQGVRSHRIKSTRPAQRRQNEKEATKKFIRLMHCNFDRKDYYVTNTYEAAPDEDSARRDGRNFIRRWQAARERAGLKKGKYMIVTEFSEEEGKRIHMHAILEGGLGRDEVEALWSYGRSNCRRLQPDEFGLTGLAKYLMKDPRGKKRWSSSRGLKQPMITYKPMSRRRAAQIAANQNAAPELLEKEYRNYEFIDITPPKWSEYVGGFYAYARMRRREGGRYDDSTRIKRLPKKQR